MLGIALLASFATLVPLAPPQETAPPGLVLVKGGRTKVGSTTDEVEKLIVAREGLRNVLAGETPQHTVDVPDFFLMPTEVTNEQYAEFVKAKNGKPPRSWGVKAIQAGAAAFLDEQGKAKQEAKAAGTPFESKVFEPEVWWEANWQDAAWEIPPGELTNPVVFVTYADAQAYARWAGLRLMSEFEFQRAARGDTARLYPWGDDWDDKKYCQSLHIGKDSSMPVGTYPDGAANGVFDLAGNVWEWTSSPFIEYPGYKQLRISVKRRAIECLAPFDPNQRVTVSGSYQMDSVGVRIATRQNADRNQSTSALGFRCAASKTPGLDAAQFIIDQDLTLATIGDTVLAPALVAAKRHWSSSAGTAKIPGYAVITGYEQILVCPREDIRAASTGDLSTATTRDGPIFLGFIDVPRPMVQPELDAGSYFVAWRGAGKLPEPKDPKQANPLEAKDPGIPFQEAPGFSADKDCYILFSREGVPVVAIDAPPAVSQGIRESAIAIEPFVPPDPKTLPKDAPPPRALDTLRITLAVKSATSRSKSMVFDLPIRVEPGTYDASWK